MHGKRKILRALDDKLESVTKFGADRKIRAIKGKIVIQACACTHNI